LNPLKTHKAIINALAPHLTEARKRRIQEVISQRTHHVMLVLDHTFHPHNISACLRSADAFGLQKVAMLNVKPKELSKGIALGTQEWLDIQHFDSASECIQQVMEQGYQLAASSMDSRYPPPQGLPLERPLALFFGGELKGLSSEIEAACHLKFHIPMAGFVESLNISVAAAITMYQVTQNLKQTYPEKFVLPDRESIRLKAAWYRRSVGSADQILKREKII